MSNAYKQSVTDGGRNEKSIAEKNTRYAGTTKP